MSRSCHIDGEEPTKVTPSATASVVTETTDNAQLLPNSQPAQNSNSDVAAGSSVVLDDIYKYMLDEPLSTV